MRLRTPLRRASIRVRPPIAPAGGGRPRTSGTLSGGQPGANCRPLGARAIIAKRLVRMRILLLSDIHSNLEALEACLAAAPPHDVVVNLGDIVGYGASPNEVIERSRASGKLFVRGNHDKAACGVI